MYLHETVFYRTFVHTNKIIIQMSKKTLRRERFESVAAKRTQKLLDLLDILGNCANKANYEYTDEDVKKMFTAIENKTKNIRTLFGRAISKQEKNKFKF